MQVGLVYLKPQAISVQITLAQNRKKTKKTLFGGFKVD